jgi:hypothetical protein
LEFSFCCFFGLSRPSHTGRGSKSFLTSHTHIILPISRTYTTDILAYSMTCIIRQKSQTSASWKAGISTAKLCRQCIGGHWKSRNDSTRDIITLVTRAIEAMVALSFPSLHALTISSSKTYACTHDLTVPVSQCLPGVGTQLRVFSPYKPATILSLAKSCGRYKQSRTTSIEGLRIFRWYCAPQTNGTPH